MHGMMREEVFVEERYWNIWIIYKVRIFLFLISIIILTTSMGRKNRAKIQSKQSSRFPSQFIQLHNIMLPPVIARNRSIKSKGRIVPGIYICGCNCLGAVKLPLSPGICNTAIQVYL